MVFPNLKDNLDNYGIFFVLECRYFVVPIEYPPFIHILHICFNIPPSCPIFYTLKLLNSTILKLFFILLLLCNLSDNTDKYYNNSSINYHGTLFLVSNTS